ncbi:uncharacterized protein [Amphiura filiformis]|uniref:uncharacterized protein n=1 Tax=Amphiura filiformis TaxID=82378 RepID=UPI003B20E4B1
MDPSGNHWIPPVHHMHHGGQPQQNLPFILQLGDHTTDPPPIEIATLEMREMETQTVPLWSDLLRLTIQKYIASRLQPLLDTHVRGYNCVHLKGLTLEEILAIVVERHNALCVDKEVVAKKQSKLVPISLEQFTETEAAAAAMVDLLHTQHDDILQQGNLNMSNQPGTMEANDNDSWSTNSGTAPKKANRKRPLESTKDELMRKGVKIIRCDPPEHIIQQEQSLRKNPSSNKRRHITAKQWYMCAQCGLKYEDITKLCRHSAVHSDIRLHSCTKCQKKFKTRDNLAKHIRGVHDKIRRAFKMFCPYCGKGFPSKVRRDDHVASHTGEVRYKCEICEKTFRSQKAQNMHFITKHDRSKAIKCPLCHCVHGSRFQLVQHLKIIHKAQLPRPVRKIQLIKCLVCNIEFQTEEMLFQHITQLHGTDCVMCKRLEKREVFLTEEAKRRGMKPEELVGKTLDELESLFKEERKKEHDEETAQLAVVNKNFIEKVIDMGMDPEAAKDIKKARRWYTQKLKEKRQEEFRLRKEADEELARKARSFMAKKKEQAEATEKRMKKETESDGIAYEDEKTFKKEISEETVKLRAEIEQLKSTINKNAMEIALDIVEELETKDVLGQEVDNQEMAIVKAELEARSKKGNNQKSFAKKIIGLPTCKEAVGDVSPYIALVGTKRETATLSESLSESPKPRQKRGRYVKSPERSIKSVKEEEKITVKALGTSSVLPKNLSIAQSPSPGADPNMCIVYSQSPQTTLNMIKRGTITYVFVRSNSAKIFATHMHSKPTQYDSEFSRKMFVNSNNPEEVKVKLLAGTLDMKIVPILLKPSLNITSETQDSVSPPPSPSEKPKLKSTVTGEKTAPPKTPKQYRPRNKGTKNQKKVIMKVKVPAIKEKTVTKCMTGPSMAKKEPVSLQLKSKLEEKLETNPTPVVESGKRNDAQVADVDQDSAEMQKTLETDFIEEKTLPFVKLECIEINVNEETSSGEASSVQEQPIACPELQTGTSSEMSMGASPESPIGTSSEPPVVTSSEPTTGTRFELTTSTSSELSSGTSRELTTGTSSEAPTSPVLSTGISPAMRMLASISQTGTSHEMPMHGTHQ